MLQASRKKINQRKTMKFLLQKNQKNRNANTKQHFSQKHTNQRTQPIFCWKSCSLTCAQEEELNITKINYSWITVTNVTKQ